jgi:hypothetical protein
VNLLPTSEVAKITAPFTAQLSAIQKELAAIRVLLEKQNDNDR